MSPRAQKIYWIEVKGPEPRVILKNAPRRGARFLDYIYNIGKVVLLSNTFTVLGKFDYFNKRLHLRGFKKIIAKPKPKPDILVLLPQESTKNLEYDFSKRELFNYLKKIASLDKKVLVYFSSNQLLENVFEELASFSAKEKIDVFTQRGLRGLRQNLEDFLKARRAVFLISGFAFDRLIWKIPADIFVLVKLPFESPNHPLIQSRIQELTNGFSEYTIKQAVIKFRGIFNKFQKSARERSVFVILDKRITSKDYGIDFVDSLSGVSIEYCQPSKLVDLIKKHFRWGKLP